MGKKYRNMKGEWVDMPARWLPPEPVEVPAPEPVESQPEAEHDDVDRDVA